jgi:hypothetical protein
LRGPSASEHRASVPAPTRVSVLSHIGLSHRRGVLTPPFRMLHGLLEYQRSSTYFRLVCLSLDLSVYHFSVDPIGRPMRLPALLFPPSSPPFFVDSLDSDL